MSVFGRLGRAVRGPRPGLWVPLAAVAGSRALLYAAIWVGGRDEGVSVVDAVQKWDSAYYLGNARDGWPDAAFVGDEFVGPGFAFFPLLPLLIRAVRLLTPLGLIESGVAVVLAGALLAAVLLWRLVAGRAGPRVADRAVVLFSLVPGSHVLGGLVYAEAVLLPAVIGCLLLLDRRRWVLAGMAGALATAARPNGIVVVACCAWAALEALRQRPRLGASRPEPTPGAPSPLPEAAAYREGVTATAAGADATTGGPLEPTPGGRPDPTPGAPSPLPEAAAYREGVTATAAPADAEGGPRDWLALAAPVLAPLGAVAYHLWVGDKTGNVAMWWRVEHEGWGERVDPLAIVDRVRYVAQHPTTDLAGWSVLVATTIAAVGLVLLARGRYPATWLIWAAGVTGLAVVSANLGLRPRFMLTAFPVLVPYAARLKGAAFVGVAAVAAAAMVVTAVLTVTTIKLVP